MRTVGEDAEPFALALAAVRRAPVRPELAVDEGPAPQRLAPHALALNAELAADPDGPVSGRFVLLHDPDGVDEWGGTFRAVVFVRSPIEEDLIADPLIHEVGWSWITESLETSGARWLNLGGTVTRTAGRSFGTMSERPADGYLEIRGSWTPAPDGDEAAESTMDRHVSAWLAVLGHCAGLPPMPPMAPGEQGGSGIAALRSRVRNEAR